ncbi:MAG: helix-turn-helix transcriptional regulator [Dyella sp.]|uniref:helix-turn-helix transcriptional regulator n=1 Tax=Dyella sp. TaxID=1869338 RepID=UPI003F7E36D5
MSADIKSPNLLGTYLKERRSQLDPAAFGFATKRRRTSGLRREEVAQRAHISVAWYTWLEQGRGGAPSADVLDRIAQALMLTHAEREYVFLLGLGRPPEVRYQQRDGVTPRLQHVLDRLLPSPAFIRTAAWDIVAWNRAATLVLADYGALPPEERNVLKHIFLDTRVRDAQHHWESAARFVVSAFRADVARAGAASAVNNLVKELCRRSADFERLWHENHVHTHGEAIKHIKHPVIGPFSFEYSAFAIDGRSDLSMVVYNPATQADVEKIESLLRG